MPLLRSDTDKSICAARIPDHLRELSKKGSPTRMATLFPQTDDIKNSVQESLRHHHYNVEDHYHEEGFWQTIARHDYFKDIILVVIIFNMIWIALETDLDEKSASATVLIEIVNSCFCLTFSVELLIRFLAFKRKRDAFRDHWFVFDGSLVALMVWETWIVCIVYLATGFTAGGNGAAATLRPMRLIRLVRVARAARLLHSVPELWVLGQGMARALRSVLAVLCLLMLVIYVFAVMFTMTLSGSRVGAGVFDTVPQALNFLLLEVLCGPSADFVLSLLAEGCVYYLMYLAFLLIALLTLMNMLIGILCEVVAHEAQLSKEKAFLMEVEKQVTRLAKDLDDDGSGGISADEFERIIRDPSMITSLHEFGVDIVDVAHFARFVYEQTDEISLPDFGQMVGQFRGSKACTVKDIMDVRQYITMELLELESRLPA